MSDESTTKALPWRRWSKGAQRWSLWTAAACFVAACGGGGGRAPEDPAQGEFTGTAAIGAPVAGGELELICAAGGRKATTGSDGRYRIELEKAVQLPCVMFVRGGTVGGRPQRDGMAGVLLRIGTVANVTPWTHLIAARLLGGDPHNAIRPMSGTEIARALTDDRVAAAREFVREQLAKVLGNAPAAAIDPIGTAFEAVPGNGMDDIVSAIYRGLEVAGKGLSLAAQEIALNGLEMYFMPSGCRAGVLSGFTGRFDDVLVQAAYRPPPSGALGGTEGAGGGTAGDDSGGGGEGAGVGGSLGQFLRTKVEVRRADGSLLGTATTDNVKGMVTLVKCDYRGPLRITLRGERTDATYYDEARKLNIPFTGHSMCAVLPGMTKNIGVTPLTNAACAYLDELVKSRTPAAGRAAWADETLIDKANAAALKAYNDHAGPNYRLDDITRLPVVIGQSLDQQSDVLGFDQNGIYAAVLAGLVQSAARYDPDAAAPALTFTEQIARDLTDGTLDHSSAAGQSAFGTGAPSYLVDQMPMQTFADASASALRLGDAALRATGTAVVKSTFFKWHQENVFTPSFSINFYYGAAVLRGDGTVVVKIVRDSAAGRFEYPDVVTPAGVRIVDFKFVPPVDALRVTVTPAKVIALSDKGEVYTLTGFDFAWVLAFGAQSRVVDVIGAPWRIDRGQITLTSEGRVAGEEVETKLPANVRFEAIGEMGYSSFHLIDASRALGAFITYLTQRYEVVPAGRRGRFVPLTPFRGLRAKMVGGAGNISDASPVLGLPASETGQLLVLDLRGQVWVGPASIEESNAGAARQVVGLDNVCYVHVWYVVGCDGALSSLHEPALPPFALSTPFFPGLSKVWRAFSGKQEAGLDEVTRAVSHAGCVYEIRYSAAAGWMVTPDPASRPRSDCVSPQWSGDPIVLTR